jgi:hypothetical protein
MSTPHHRWGFPRCVGLPMLACCRHYTRRNHCVLVSLSSPAVAACLQQRQVGFRITHFEMLWSASRVWCEEDIIAALPSHLVRFGRFPYCGHSVITDAPDQVSTVIRDFIGSKLAM